MTAATLSQLLQQRSVWICAACPTPSACPAAAAAGNGAAAGLALAAAAYIGLHPILLAVNT
jgi:hypothetical protein